MASSRRKFLIAGISVGLSLSLPYGSRAFGGDGEGPVSVDAAKVAIQGYDTVAYFTDGRPVRGNPQFEFEWSGARWHFVSAAHRDLFSKRPESFAPRFGGFCAGAIAQRVFVRPDPEAWVIVDGKLYLNGSKEGLVEWKQDDIANIAKAQDRWDGLGQ